MKKGLFLLSLIILTACKGGFENSGDNPTDKSPISKKIGGEVSHGLHLITINDTTTILIYRGVESCTMIQIK
jgi:hypothetical protein